MIPAGGHEGRARELRHHVEAKHVAVKGQRALDIAHVQVNMTNDEIGIGLRSRLLVGHRADQRLHVERTWPDRRRVPQVPPALPRPIGGQLDAVVVGVGEVDRLRDPVVGGTADRRARQDQPLRSARELPPRLVQQREWYRPACRPAGRAPGSSTSLSRSSPPAPITATGPSRPCS